LDVIGGVLGLQSDRFADHESNSLGLTLADTLGRFAASLREVKEAMRHLVGQTIEFLGGGLSRQERDFLGCALALRRINGIRVFELDVAFCDELP